MPSYDLAAIRTKISALLATVTGVAYVYSRRNPIIEGYPCMIFDIVQNTNEMLTNVDNLRTITFRIWIVQEIPKTGMDNANRILDVLTKNTISVLEDISNITLTNSIDYMMPVEGAREEVSSPEGSAIWQVLDLQVRVSSNVL